MRMAGTVLPILIAATMLAFAAHSSLAGGGDAVPAEGNMQVASTGGGLAALFGGGRNLSGFRKHVNAGAIVVRASTPTECLPHDLKGVLAKVAEEFGAISVQSTHRSPKRNRRAGGAPQSLHLDCRAIDFRVDARGREVMAWLREHPDVGGLKMYRNGVIHIDNGARRTW
ncbi:YcbK family protein [Saliniramus sp.]|uniref:YcbK family protein n=1 Tax=Saliniramus sp. TaxID=2986772 RepID=UPI002CEF6DFD|nr:D-Ala-D-Ala carboxypeptidase family metallohydrolase [Saliniramus sp.]HMB09144.1 D-Ala-D-Ala carboxypeptidase family metallohydrolase [Saliniramus sp.]